MRNLSPIHDNKDLPTKSHIESCINTATQNVAGAIEDLVDGTTAVEKANTATSATSAGKLSAAVQIAITGAVTGSVSTDLSGNVEISTTIPDETITASKLEESGVEEGDYTAVSVDTKGRVIAGKTAIEFGTSGQTTPSANLVVGGLFFELQE